MAGLASLGVQFAWAAQWDIVPRMRLKELYSDNIELTSTNEQDDFVTETTPGVSIRGVGSRLLLNADYNFQNLVYANDSDRNSSNHQLQANSTAELWKHVLFFDARALMTQQLVDNAGRFSNSNASVTGNRTDTTSYGFSPYVRHHFGALADLEARYEYSKVSYDLVSASSSESDHFTNTLSSGRLFRRVPWSLTYDDVEYRYDSGATSRLRSVTTQISYVINRMYRIDSTLGHESNDYASTRSSIDGMFWTIGGAWTPSLRTELAFGIGDRYFGTNFYVRARHLHRRLQFTANYDERPQNSSNLAGQGLIPLVDLNGDPVFDPNLSSDFPLVTDSTAISDQVFIQKRLNATLTYTRPRDAITLSGITDSRSFEGRGSDESVIGFSANWRHFLSKRLSGGLDGSWYKSTFSRDTSRTDDRMSIRPFVSYDLGRSLSATVEYLYYDNSSDDARNAYTENRLSAILNVHL